MSADLWAREEKARAKLIRAVTGLPIARCQLAAARLVEQARRLHATQGLPPSHPCYGMRR